MIFGDFIFNNLTSILLFLVTFIMVYVGTRRRTGVPPGPQCWPILGNIASLIGKDTIKIFRGLRRRYGDVYGLYIGQQLVIVLNGYDVIHDALVKRGTLFSKRPENKFTELMQLHRDHDVVFGDGAIWKELRVFSMNTLNNLCFDRNDVTLEDRIHTELDHLTDKLNSFNEPVDLSHIIPCAFANLMYSILHGRRAGYENKRFNEYIKSEEESVKRYGRDQVMHYCFPFLYLLPGDLLNIKKKFEHEQRLQIYFAETYKENFKNYSAGDRRCIADYWLEKSVDSHTADETFHVDNLWVFTRNMIIAGTETTSAAFRWLLLCLILHPSIQDQLHASIITVIGKDRVPSIKDREDLPFVEACILETLRIGNVVPLSIPHSVPRDISFNGYIFPKDCTIFPNISSVNMDQELFPDPEEFKPERFLSDDMSTIVNTDKFIPFSLGPRSCLGETVAKMELFLFTTSLLQRFEFRLPKGSKQPTMLGGFGLANKPQSYEVEIVKRNY